MRTYLPSAMFAIIFFMGCASQPPIELQAVPVNPNAKLAFFNECNLNQKMRFEYAAALQNSGLYNFKTETPSDEQLENAIEFRLNYSEESGTFKGVPVLILKVEIFKKGNLSAKINLKEVGNEIAFNPRNLNSAKKHRQKILLERFLEEIRRIS